MLENTTKLITFFDTTERSSNEEVLNEILNFKQNALLMQLLEGYPQLAVLLNKNRQIVAFNSKALNLFKVGDYLKIIGMRIGEALSCIHKEENEAGCGTSQFCKECGAANAIRNTNTKLTNCQEECRIIANQDNSEIAYEFMVHTRPIHLNNQVYTLFAIDDISDQKRREALERIFFHDVLNTAGVVNGIAQMLPEIDEEAEQIELVGILQNSAQQLIDEIKAQRELRHAEDGNLEPILENISVNNIIERVINLYKNHPLVNEQKIISEVLLKDITFVSDKTLLVRSLGNLMKNAIEASIPGDTVKLYPVLSDTSIIFNIYNERVIPNNIQLQLFQRSFSTKQKAGRGIGLYSVKLIIEQYLKGKVSFISDEKSKTIFSVSIPIIN
jgi:hypothetical protein